MTGGEDGARGRGPRLDAPGILHHILARGLGRWVADGRILGAGHFVERPHC